jgi:hypothetical protein
LRLYQLIEKEAADLDAGDVNETNRDWLMRLESVKRLMSQNETLAEAAELEIWRELRGGTSPNLRLSTDRRVTVTSVPRSAQHAAVVPWWSGNAGLTRSVLR